MDKQEFLENVHESLDKQNYIIDYLAHMRDFHEDEEIDTLITDAYIVKEVLQELIQIRSSVNAILFHYDRFRATIK